MSSKKYNRRLCDSCGSSSLRKSHTRAWERPLRLLSLRPYRCRDCDHRQYGFILHPAAVEHPSHSFSYSQSPSCVADATEGAARRGHSRKWLLIYGLLTVVFIGAIVSLRVSALQHHHSSTPTPSSVVRPPNKTHGEPTQNETPAVNSNLTKAPQTTTDAAGNSHAFIQSAEPRSSVSHQEDDRAAEAIRAPRPKIPSEIQSTITTDNTVAVRVRIDPSGSVVEATPVSASGTVAKSLVGYALTSARQWRFHPARRNGKPVGSERVLEFLFRPSGS